MLESPAFCFASCFSVCFPWGCFSCCFFACASMALIAFCSISAVSFAPLTESATTFSLISSCNVYRPPFPVVVIVLRWYAAFGREKRASVLHAAPLNPHPQPVQVLGADTYKIPVVPVLNPGRLPFAACEYVHALAAMQFIYIFTVQEVTNNFLLQQIHFLLSHQCIYFSILLLRGNVGLHKMYFQNDISRMQE